jgi:hypothetical protein
MVRKKNGLLNASLLLLLVSVFGMVFSAAAGTGSSNGLQFVRASTEGDGDSGGGGGDDNGGGDSGGDSGGGGNDDDSEPDPEPQPDPDPDPAPDPEPQPDPTLPVDPVVPEPPVLVTCPDGSQVENANDCPTSTAALAPPAEELPLCDGTPQRCITEGGYICEIGSADHGCECAEDMSDCPMHPSLLPPLESPSPKPIYPYCDLVPDDYEGTCHDRKDFDEDTGLYPCNDGTQQADWRDCEDAYVPPEKPCDYKTDPNCNEPPIYCQALGCPGSSPDPELGCFDGREPVNGICPGQDPCKDGYELINGKCVEEKPEPPKCPPGYVWREKQQDCYKEITVIINEIIKETNEGKHKDGFPDVDIIGLSVKENADAMICAMDIDSDHIECQEFAMPQGKVNQDFWRIIETDSTKNYDNGNTGSSDIDDAIEDIKSQDFNELEDADNHNFGIDLAWVAINPQGEGVTCLTTDQSGKGKSLCEPFKVSAQDVSGQITEGIEFN